LVGEFTETPNPEAQRYPIRLFFCKHCKVLLIDESIDSEKLFNVVGFIFSHIAYCDNFDILYFMIKLIHCQEYDILVS
jgi:hypothetical protein